MATHKIATERYGSGTTANGYAVVCLCGWFTKPSNKRQAHNDYAAHRAQASRDALRSPALEPGPAHPGATRISAF